MPALNDEVAGARLLLDYAVSRGLVTDPAIITPIVQIEELLAAQANPDATAIAAFLQAYNALSKLTDGVSADSLSAAARKDQARTRRAYFAVLTLLLLLSIPITIGNQVASGATSEIAAMCKDYPEMGCDSAAKDKPVNYDTSAPVINDISTRTMNIWSNLKILSFFSDFSGSSQSKLDLIWKNNTKPDGSTNIWGVFKDTYYQSFAIVDDFKLIYGTLTGYAVPILFSMLGAVMFGLRDLHQRADPPTWVSHSRSLATLRIVTAGLAGFLITAVAGITSDIKFSPILIALIIGYSLDVFFALLDALVSQFKGLKGA